MMMNTNDPYVSAYEALMKKRQEEADAAQAIAPTDADRAGVKDSQGMGNLLNNLFKSSAMMGSVGGKPTAGTGVDFSQMANMDADNLKDRQLRSDKQLNQVNQNYEMNRQSTGDLFNVDKYNTDKTLAADKVSADTEQRGVDNNFKRQELELRRQDLLRKGQQDKTLDKLLGGMQAAETLRKSAGVIEAEDPARAKLLREKADEIERGKPTEERKFKINQADDLAKGATKQDVVAQALRGQLEHANALMKKGDTAGAYQIADRMLKTINSPMGSDAIGAEESSRIGNQLAPFSLKRLLSGGKMVGQDLPGFLKSAEDSLVSIETGRDALLKKSEDLTGFNLRQNKGTTSKKEISPKDQSALDWAAANSNDPDAKNIQKHLGAKYGF